MILTQSPHLHKRPGATATWISQSLFDRPISPELKRSIIETVAAEVGRPVDVVDLNSAPEPVLGEALRGDRLLGDNVAYARLINRHVLNAADFLPLRQRILSPRGFQALRKGDL